MEVLERMSMKITKREIMNITSRIGIIYSTNCFYEGNCFLCHALAMYTISSLFGTLYTTVSSFSEVCNCFLCHALAMYTLAVCLVLFTLYCQFIF